tara:strand:+ start:29 stop:1219 length:1191 start_codon:yes stop_codon:yes gene_type:complete
MNSEPRKKNTKSFVIICDSVIPALLAYSTLHQSNDLTANLLIIIEYTERDGCEDFFFKAVEFIFKSVIGRKNVRVTRHYSNEQRHSVLLNQISWLTEAERNPHNEIELLISSSSKLESFWRGIFKTTILMHSLLSVKNLSKNMSRVEKFKKLAKSLIFKLQIYGFLAMNFEGRAFRLIKRSILNNVPAADVAVPFAMRSIESSLVVDFFGGIERISWEQYSSEIASTLKIFSNKNIQVIVIPVTGDEPIEKRGCNYNLLKYRICYERIFLGLKHITDPSKNISVIYKSHKRYLLLSTAEKAMLIESTNKIGASDCVFLEGENAELPLEFLPVRPWDIIIGECSFAVMTMSIKAKCFWADTCFAPMRPKDQQDRTDINKEFARHENLDIKNLPIPIL